MGYYVNYDSKGNLLQNHTKTEQLIEDGAIAIPPPTAWREGLVCVVDNVTFQAVGYAFSAEEMNEFLRPTRRPTQWLLYTPASKISGYDKENPNAVKK